MKGMEQMVVDGSVCVIPLKTYFGDKYINGHASSTM